MIRIFDGIEELLEKLEKKGSTLGVVTSRTREELELVLDQLPIRKYFSICICADDTKEQKPRHVDKNIQKYPRMFILFQPASEFTTFFFAHYTTAPFHMQSFNLCDCNDYSTI